MKRTSTLRPAFAFTLIELLTVIAIIGVLMGLLFPAVQGARENARRNEAGVQVRTVVNAANAYYNDYGKFPAIEEAKEEAKSTDDNSNSNAKEIYYIYGETNLGASNGGGGASGGGDGKSALMNNQEIFDILRAIGSRGENKDHKYNKRQVKYLDGKKATDAKVGQTRSGFADGQEFGEERQGRLYDPWGTQYFVVLDADGDEELSLGEFWQDLAASENKVRFKVVSFSLGKDGGYGGKSFKNYLKKANSNEPADDIVSWQ